jgi:PadR family transcriptional regulator, regulatory protein PadR
MPRDRRPSNQTLVLIGALLQRPRQWLHGYDLSIATGLKSGTLYPILMRLSDRGFLEHKWQNSPDPGRPARHMYRLTAAGSGFARTQLSDNPAAMLSNAVPRGAT